MPFLDSLDIANRAIQHCGGNQIASITEDSKNNQELSFAYDKLRRAELQRNIWTFATRKAVLRPIDTTTLLLNPLLYDASAMYLLGAVVRDVNNQYWISLKPDNRGQIPGGNNDYWDAYFGPLTASLYTTTTAYYSGELVYKAGAIAGSYQVYMSLKNGNSDAPDVANAWDVGTTYYADQCVSFSGSQWRSIIPFNLGISPADGPSNWDIGTTYASGNQVTGSNNRIYTSAVNGNVGHDPTTDSGTNWTATTNYNAWSRSPTITASATSWRPLGDTALKSVSIAYPVGAGPASDQTSRNVYYLPAGFLRRAPQDPRAGSTSSVGAPGGLAYDDWVIENKLLISSESDPIVLRFVADVSVVSLFHDMFCEGLACRIAVEVADSLTQSNTQMQTIASAYQKFMGEARLVNAIEGGAVEPPLDDYLACRA